MPCGSPSINKKPVNPAFNSMSACLSALNLRKGLDALGAERLADEYAIFEHPHALKIRFKFVPGCAHGVAATVAEHRPLATHLTLRHDEPP